MIVGTLQIGLLLHGCQSLKEKRMILNGLKSRIKNKFNVSIAEVDQNEKWQRTTIGIATVANEKKYIQGIFNKILNLINSDVRVELIDQFIDIY